MNVLLRGGLVIDTEPAPYARPGTDVLIENGRIAAVGPDLSAGDSEVIDATGRIVLPGFVDAHRHMWQTVLRGIAVDADLGGYLDLVLARLAPAFRPEDVHAGTLVGGLECLDGGVTTVQEYSHIQYAPEHTDAGIAALHASGIRSVYGYGFPVFSPDRRDLDAVRRAHAEHFTGTHGLLTMRLAPAGPSYAPIEVVVDDWRLARELGIGIAVHISNGAAARHPVEALHDHGLLGADTLYVHGNNLSDDELKLVAESGGAVAISPAIEAQMGHGAPMAGRLRAAGVTTGLGVDAVTTVAGDMFTVMRATLTSGHLGEGPRLTAADVLRLATVDGAAAVGLGDEVGSLRPGKWADLVLLRADDVNLAGGLHDPVGTVVTAAHPGNVDTVLVAGEVVKRDGRLTNPAVTGAVDAVRRSAGRLRSYAE